MELLREKISNINSKGMLESLVYNNGDVQYRNDFKYDIYGNIIEFIGPENDNKERTSVKVEYDKDFHLLPIKISNSWGEISRIQYTLPHKLPYEVENVNGEYLIHSYDDYGRLKEVLAPKEAKIGKSYTLKFDYNLNDLIGTTTHNTPDGEIVVQTYSDPLGRDMYATTQSFIHKTYDNKIEIIQSAWNEKDAFGRETKLYKSKLANTNDSDVLSVRKYDKLDRLVSNKMIDGSETIFEYSIEDVPDLGEMSVCKQIDALGNISKVITNILDQIRAQIRYNNNEEIRTSNEYDALGRLTSVIHPNDSISIYKYDALDNIIEYTSPDAGTTKFAYNPNGTIKSKTTANEEKIEYHYKFDKLTGIIYENRPEDNVHYSYGDSTGNRLNIGQLISVEDASGSEYYQYGVMGEIVHTVKEIIIDPIEKTKHTYAFDAEYDSWGRIRKMTYPDGEVVKYLYHPTGQLKSIIGKNLDKEECYLKEQAYNINGQVAYRLLGNGSLQRFEFDEKDRLSASYLIFKDTLHKECFYNYDLCDNIIALGNDVDYVQYYQYDDLYRLISAKGEDTQHKSSYTLTMSYNNMASPTMKLLEINTPDSSHKQNYTYFYTGKQPNAPSMIADKRYKYDNAGNPISIESMSNEFDNRYFMWDSENRLRRLDTQSESYLYTYNHVGERTLKRFASAENLSINGAARGSLMSLSSEFTAYISPYFIATDNSYTKHYFSEGTRIASKIGTAVYNATPSVDSSVTNIVSNPIDMQAGSTYSSSGEEEKDLYFFHTDHLGSTTYLTGREEVEQYIAYTPYGEPFVETRSVSPYKFNGKELDSETGLYYYGARYYNPVTTLWLGVDPLASKKPNVSPYLYCLGNPINFIDPDGRDEESHNNVMSVFASRDPGIAYEVRLNDVIIEGTKFQYDQPYGQTITGGVGSGVETTSKYKGPSIDASQFSYPFGGGNKSIGEFMYSITAKVMSFFMCSGGKKNDKKSNSLDFLNDDVKYTYNHSYYNTVTGDFQSNKNKYGVDRVRGDTIEFINIITSVKFNGDKLRDTIITPHIPHRYKYRK